MELYSYAGYEIPVSLINMTGGGPETFGPVADHHVADLRATVGVEPSHSIVEIGCGVGKDAITFTNILSNDGSYLGVDIIKPSIDWCQANIAKRHPNFRFVHFDVKDEIHNPNGTTSTQDIRLPVPSGSVDRVILWSVFTHLFRPAIVHYMKEFTRILKPDGLVFATCFVFDDEALASARKTDVTPWHLFFEHEYEPGCRINDPNSPLGAIAYSREAVADMVSEAGLVLERPIEGGSWSGLPNMKHSQDVMVLRRAAQFVRTHVELGCGNNKRKGFFGVDFADGSQVDLVMNVERDALPFPDNSVEHLYSSHMFEHLTYQQNAWREVFRVCKPGALVEIWTPYGKSNDGLLFGHLTFFTETSFKHICYEYDRAYLEDRHGFFEWYQTHYVLHPDICDRLNGMRIPIDFALDHMMNIGLEWGVFLRVRKDLPRAPGPQNPHRIYSRGNRHEPIGPEQLTGQTAPPAPVAAKRSWLRSLFG